MSKMKDMYVNDFLYDKEMSEPYDYREYMILEIVNHIHYKKIFSILWVSIYQWDPEESLSHIMNILESKTYDELLDIINKLKW